MRQLHERLAASRQRYVEQKKIFDVVGVELEQLVTATKKELNWCDMRYMSNELFLTQINNYALQLQEFFTGLLNRSEECQRMARELAKCDEVLNEVGLKKLDDNAFLARMRLLHVEVRTERTRLDTEARTHGVASRELMDVDEYVRDACSLYTKVREDMSAKTTQLSRLLASLEHAKHEFLQQRQRAESLGARICTMQLEAERGMADYEYRRRRESFWPRKRHMESELQKLSWVITNLCTAWNILSEDLKNNKEVTLSIMDIERTLEP